MAMKLQGWEARAIARSDPNLSPLVMTLKLPNDALKTAFSAAISPFLYC
jgi:hypothetical protein